MVNPGRIGVLAFQGDFAEHLDVLDGCGFDGFEVRSPSELEEATSLVIPGGESTTISMMIDRVDLREPLEKRILGGMPVFGTCAGAIVLAEKVLNGDPSLKVFPAEIERNAFGRQIDSFEAEIDVPRLETTVRALFIRAPVVRAVGPGVEVLASLHGLPVLCRAGKMLISTFHTETSGEAALHRYFVEALCAEERR